MDLLHQNSKDNMTINNQCTKQTQRECVCVLCQSLEKYKSKIRMIIDLSALAAVARRGYTGMRTRSECNEHVTR